MSEVNFYLTLFRIILSLVLCKVSPNAFCNVILSIKQIGSEKLDFSLFGQNIFYPESSAHRAVQLQTQTY